MLIVSNPVFAYCFQRFCFTTVLETGTEPAGDRAGRRDLEISGGILIGKVYDCPNTLRASVGGDSMPTARCGPRGLHFVQPDKWKVLICLELREGFNL